MGGNTTKVSPDDSMDDIENRSGVVNDTSYSLQDTSGLHNEPSGLSDVEMLDPTVKDLLDDPYRLKLGRNNKYHGFDQSFGDSWIYPANYPMRQYQFTITEAALFKNTLVVLPTGLGKTFIAAVVMYNIYRWYPTGKVIFMAPTRPLIHQQVEACHQIMGIPKTDTVEMNGNQPRHKRSDLWKSKRVFYATPGVVLADLEAPEQTFPVQQVRLIVIDEAHRANRRYAYTDVIRRVAERNPYFRVLALSATPGRTLDDVAKVITNLLISHVEVRWDNSIDVLPYVFRKDVRTIVIPLGQTIARIRKDLLQLIKPYMLRLIESNVFTQYPSTISSAMLVMRQKQFKKKALQQHHPNYSAIIADFDVCISMYEALDLLVKHGIRTFINFFDGGTGTNVQEKYFVANDQQIKIFLDQLRIQFYHQEQQSILTDSAIITEKDDIDFGHPKYRILEQQLMTFFKQFPNSKAIVFCEFRDSVAMIKSMLSKNQPVIRPNCIFGQGGTSGIRVEQQKLIDVMRLYRSGTYNTLIATCVAEVAMDVGEVDLIVCFDLAKNPIQFVQRIGRTDRQPVGQVLILVTEGEEHDTLKQVLASKDKISQQLARSKEILRKLYPNSPRLVPAGLQPKCVKMYINVSDEQATVRNPCSDSSVEEGCNTTKDSGRKRRCTRQNNNANKAIEPPAKRNKTNTTTRYVMDFFPPQRKDPKDVLNGSERDMFVVQSYNQRERDGSRDRSHFGKASIPIDKTIRLGRTDAQVAIDAQLLPLIRHYQQLCQQKFLYGQKLLNGFRMTNKAEMPINSPVLDDPLDLPELVPHEGGRADVSQAVEESFTTDKSISNLFDLSLCLMESPSIGTNPLEGTSNSSNKNVSAKNAGASTLENPKRHSAAPKDLCNSPLFLAFNRSVQKRKTSEVLETSALTSNTAAPITPLNEQRSSFSRSMVLEYFRMKRLENIFDDDSSDELVSEKVTTINDQKQGGEKAPLKETSISRNLFGEPKPVQTKNVPAKYVTKAVDEVFDRANLEPRPSKQNNTSVTMLNSGSNISKKNFDLGTAELVFEDDSDNDSDGSTTPFKYSSIKSSQSQATHSRWAKLRMEKSEVFDFNRDDMYCPTDKSAFFAANYVKRSSAAIMENGNEACEISNPASDNNNKCKHDTTTPSKYSSSESSQSQATSSKWTKLRMEKRVVFDPSKKDMCSSPDKSASFAASSYVKRASVPIVENGKQACEISDTMSTGSDISWVQRVDMNDESIIGRQNTSPRILDSSKETDGDETFEFESQNINIWRRLTGTAASVEDEENDSFPSAVVGQQNTSPRILDSSKEIDGDETFEFESQNINIWRRLTGTAASVEDEENDSFPSAVVVRSTNASSRRNQNKQSKTKPAGREFIVSQAVVSDDDDDGDDEAKNDDMGSLEDFITDTDDEKCTADMRSVYLQSVRSPRARHGGFKIPARAPVGLMLNDTDAQYSEEKATDTFDANLLCSFINDNTDECSSSELSELEKQELLLEERRQRKKITRSLQQSSRGKKKQRRRIRRISSDSASD